MSGIVRELKRLYYDESGSLFIICKDCGYTDFSQDMHICCRECGSFHISQIIKGGEA
jgi:hypothetical protein